MVYLLLNEVQTSKGHDVVILEGNKALGICVSWLALHLGKIKMRQLFQTPSKIRFPRLEGYCKLGLRSRV